MGLDFGKMRAPVGEIPEEKEKTLLEKVMPLLA
jgi:hypothetical protein